MPDFKLKVEKREISTKGYLNQLRKNNQIPAICYGQGQNVNLTVNRKEFEKTFLQTGEHILIELDISKDKKRKVLVKNYQISPVQKEISHIDFFEVNDKKALIAKIPVILIGSPKGVKLGGILEHKLVKLSIETFPKDIPKQAEIDISELDVGDSIYVENIKLDKNVKIITKSRQAVATVAISRVTKLEEESKEESPEQTEEKPGKPEK